MALQQWIKALVVLTVMMLGGVALIPTAPVLAAPHDQSFAATVEPLGGLVQQLPAGKVLWQTLSKVALLQAGDQIRTADAGVAQLSTLTGVKVIVYPNTLIALNKLSLGTGNNSALTFVMSQTIGISYVNIERTLKTGDSVQIVTPSVIANVHGTRFYSFVSRSGHTAIIGEENTVNLLSPNKPTQKNDPDNIGYYSLNITGTSPNVCTSDLLKNSSGMVVKDLASESNRQVLRQFLADFLQSNVNSKTMGFLIHLLNLPDSATPKEVLDALAKFDDKQLQLPAFLKNFRVLLTDYLGFETAIPLAPTTCGNGKKDDGETLDNCKVDVADVSPTCGNGLCETEKVGESFLNCAADCLPFGTLAQSCTQALNRFYNLTPAPTLGPKITPTGGPSATPTPSLVTPNPSGVG